MKLCNDWCVTCKSFWWKNAEGDCNLLRVRAEICRSHCLRLPITSTCSQSVRTSFVYCVSGVLLKTFVDIVWQSIFFFFSLNHTHITCKQPKPRQNVFLSSKRLSHKLLCVYGVWWGWQAIIESTKCIFSWMPGESLTQLNLFSIFNIKNMCLETTSFPCILVPIVSSSLVRTLILIKFRNINRVSLGSKFFIREKKRFSSHPVVCTQRDQRCENLANAVFVFHPRRSKNFNFPFFTRRRFCSRFNERLAGAAPDENR